MDKTIKNLLLTALEPIGKVLYIYGGGWNYYDTGGSKLTKNLGLSKSWIDFFNSQNEYYNYKNYYPLNKRNVYSNYGLDCSGYIGWVLYNVFRDKKEYVLKSTTMARTLATKYKYGEFSQNITKIKAGDIFSINGHVWMCLGSCKDKSIVICHSSPTNNLLGFEGGGVQISAIGSNEKCDAYLLAKKSMRCCSKWNEYYKPALMPFEKYIKIDTEDCGNFSWNINPRIIKDNENYREMCAEDLLEDLLNF